MATSAITPAATSSFTAGTTSAIAGAPTQVDFLKLLTTQLKNQDPMNPVTDSQFASQLAQFSQLQGIQQLNANFSNLLLLQQLTQGVNLVGKTAQYLPAGASKASQGNVDGVNMVNGQLQLVIAGKTVPLNQVQGFVAPSSGGILGNLLG